MRAHRKVGDVDNAKLDAAFSRKVKERDGNVCRMEIWNGSAWVQHGIRGSADNPLDAAHVYSRTKVGKWKFEPINGVCACRNCHDRYDGRDVGDGAPVRISPARERAAYLFLTVPGRLKVPLPRQIPPERPE
jgi:hypothetical protein